MGPYPSSSRRVLYLVLLLAISFAARVQADDQGEFKPDDPLVAYQPAVFAQAWEIAHEAPDIIVAVIDSGIDAGHPDLSENLWVNSAEVSDNGEDDDDNGYVDDRYGYDFVHDDLDPEDEVGHGTIMAGIIGAVGNNQIGMAGAAWSIQLMNLKVLGENGAGKLSDFVEAIHYAIDNGAVIISAAWTFDSSEGDEELPTLREAIERADREGVLIVAAAGNDGKNLDEVPVYPASYSMGNLISVAALSDDETRLAPFSNYGAATVDIAAPGDEILGTLGEDSYGTLTGTSPATAIVAGAAGLIWSVGPNLSPSEVRSLLIAGADPREDLTGRYVSGGALDVYQSLSLAQSTGLNPSPEGAFGVVEGTSDGAAVQTTVSAGGCSLHISFQ